MADSLTTEQRSERMRRVRQRDASLEVVHVDTSMHSNRRGEQGDAARLEQGSLRSPRG
jgi:hypothetical protein